MVRGQQNDSEPEINHFKLLVRADGLSDERWEALASEYYGNPQQPLNSATKAFKLTEMNKKLKKGRRLMGHQLFSTICPLCKSNKHSGDCSKNGVAAKEAVRLEAVKYHKILQVKEAAAAEKKRKVAVANRLAEAARKAKSNADTAATEQLSAVCCDRHNEEGHDCEPDGKRTKEQKDTDLLFKELVYSFYIRRVKPIVNPHNSRFLLPNPHVMGSRTARQVYGTKLKVPIIEHQEAAIHLYLADRQLVVVSPRIYFPGDWDISKVFCPHCDMLPTEECGFECQGLIYLPRQVYGIGSERLWIMGDVYCHIGCCGKKKRQFTVTNPKVMAQFAPAPAAAYDFIVRQRTVFTREVVEHDALFRAAGVGAQTLVNVSEKLEGGRRTKLEIAQAVSEIKARKQPEPCKAGEISFKNEARDKPVQLLSSVLHGTYTGREPGVHARGLAFLSLMVVLGPFYVAAMLRLGIIIMAIDQTFKIAQAIKQRGIGGGMSATYSNMCTAMNEKREVVLACFAKDKSHKSQTAAMKSLAARAKKLDPTGIGVRTVVSDNPEGDKLWLWGIFTNKLQVLGDPFHYLQEFGKAATKRSSKSGLWAMAVSSAFWIANKADVVKDRLWREKQQPKVKKSQKKTTKNKNKGKNTGKSNPKYTRYGKNPHVRHTPASKEVFLAGLERAKEFAKNVLKIRLNYTTLEAATDRIKLAFDNHHLDEPLMGAYQTIKTNARDGFMFVTNRGSSVLEAFHRVLRKIVQGGSSDEIQTHFTLLPFVYLYNERRRAKNDNDSSRVTILDPRSNNQQKLVYGQLHSSLNEEAQKRFDKMNKTNSAHHWTYLEPGGPKDNTVVGVMREGSDASWSKAFQDRLSHMLSSSAEDDDVEYGDDFDEEEDGDSFEFQEFESSCTEGVNKFRTNTAASAQAVIPYYSNSMIASATRRILKSMHDHLPPKLRRLGIAHDDTTLYKPKPVRTEEEVLLFSTLFDSRKFVKSPGKFHSALSHDPHTTLHDLAHNTTKMAEKWRMEQMAEWWCLQMVLSRSVLDAEGKAMLTNPIDVVVTRGKTASVLKWTDSELNRLSKIDMCQVMMKDVSTLTSHMGEHAKIMLRNLGPGTDRYNRPFMEIGEETHDLSATFDRLTSVPMDTTTSTLTAPELLSAQLRSIISPTVSRDVPQKEGNTYCYFCEKLLNGNGHKPDCLVRHFFPKGVRYRGIDGLSLAPGDTPRSLRQIKTVEAHMSALAANPTQHSGLPLKKLAAQRRLPGWAQWAQRKLDGTDMDLVAKVALANGSSESAATVKIEGGSVGCSQARLTQGYVAKRKKAATSDCEDDTLLSTLVPCRSIVSTAPSFNQSKRVRMTVDDSLFSEQSELIARLDNYSEMERFNKTFCCAEDLKRLVSFDEVGGWLNDECINGFLIWITAGVPFATWESMNLLRVPTAAKPSSQRRFVRQGGDLKANRAAFVPWNKNNNHWTLWVVFGHGKHMDYYEPMSENVDEADRARKRSMLDYASAMAGSNLADWSVEMAPLGVPSQNDGFNCGVILLLFALRLVCGLDVAGVCTELASLRKARLVLTRAFIDQRNAREVAVSLGWVEN